MTIRYRTAGAWGPGTGADLAPAYVDENFYTLDHRVQTIEALPPPAAHIDHFTITGDQLTVHMSDGTSLGPYTLPVVPLTFRGDWLPNTAYFAGEMFSHGSSIYQVLVNHTSAATFDAGANDGAGHNYYGFGLSLDGGLPAGGATGQWLQKATSADFAVTWADPPTPPPVDTGGSTTMPLNRFSSDAFSLSGTHLGKFNVVQSAAASTVAITVPAAASWTAGTLTVGAMAHFREDWEEPLIFTGATGVTINGVEGFANQTDGVQGAVVTLYYAGSDEWFLYGLLKVSP